MTNSHSTSPFSANKQELLRSVLERYDVRFSRVRRGWQQISCLDSEAHPRGDRNPSASANLDVGYYTCHACGLKGDGFALMLHLEGMKAADVLAELKQERGKVEETWLVDLS